MVNWWGSLQQKRFRILVWSSVNESWTRRKDWRLNIIVNRPKNHLVKSVKRKKGHFKVRTIFKRHSKSSAMG